MNPESLSISSASNSKDFAKKKRANRSAKLKQCKLDARREQWLSQVKNKGSKEERDDVLEPSVRACKERNYSLENNLDMRQGGEENQETLHHHGSDLGLCASNSPLSVLGSSVSGTNFTSSSSSSSGECWSGCLTEDEEEDTDGCLDDWEAVADALAANDKNQNPCPEPTPKEQMDSSRGLTTQANLPVEIPKPEGLRVSRTSGVGQAWRSDDASRPQSLPNLSKQHSFPMNSQRHYACGASVWAYNNIVSAPSSCPICFEDLDTTDSSFLPCLCGFRLCLFCHKRILEEDGRCPGCRKPYDDNEPVKGEASFNGGSLTFRLARSCSMTTRS